MSDKLPLNDHQSALKKEEQAMDGPKPETDKDRRICSICKQKPTISDSSTYCASCMGKRGNEKLRQRAIKAPKQEKDKRMKEETRPMPGKSIVGQI